MGKKFYPSDFARDAKTEERFVCLAWLWFDLPQLKGALSRKFLCVSVETAQNI